MRLERLFRHDQFLRLGRFGLLAVLAQFGEERSGERLRLGHADVWSNVCGGGVGGCHRSESGGYCVSLQPLDGD